MFLHNQYISFLVPGVDTAVDVVTDVVVSWSNSL